MNHKWKDNVCINCGLHREKRDFRKLKRTYSKLIHGVWEDIPVWEFGTAWWYGLKNKFNRPDCKKEK